MAKQKNPNSGWKIVFRYLGKYKKEIIILSVLGVISALANGVVPFIVGSFLDAVLGQSQIFVGTAVEMPLWLFFLISLGIVQLIANVVDWINDRRSRLVGLEIAVDYPSDAIKSLLALPMSFHKEEKSGELWDKFARGSNYLVQIIERVVINITPQLLSVVVGLSIAFYIHPALAVVIVSGVLVYVGTLVKIVPPIVELQKSGHRAWNKAYGTAYDSVANVHAIKQSTAETHELKRVIHKFAGVAAPIWKKVERIWSGIAFYQRVIVTITQLAVFALSIYFIRDGSLTIGGLIALNGYAAMVFGPFVQLGYNWQTIQNGLIAVERAEKLIMTTPESYTPRDIVPLKGIRGEIEFRKVNFSYKTGESNVLNNIELKINAGEVVALVGESGVGKSTLVELISGYYFPTKGDIFIDGENIQQISLKQLRGSIAVVPQEVVLFNDTIKANIRYGTFGASDTDLIRASKEAYASDFIEKFPKKYNQLVGERGIKLSVGQKQRVAIARAILRDPKILILDEPTSALDVQTEKYIEKSLENLMRGRTTIIIAHRLITVRRADKIFVFDKGRLVEEGKHDELIKVKNGIYRKLYELHIGLQ